MKNLFLILIFIVSVFSAYSQENAAGVKPVLSKFLNYYSHNHADSIFNLFSDDTKNALPIDKTKQLITQLHTQLGNIIKNDYLSGTTDYTVYKCHFEKPGYALFLNFDKNNEIIGLFLRPDEEEEDKSDTFLSPDNVSLKTSYGSLYGSLAVPETAGKVPVVLFIAGSGPTDRNNNSVLGLKTNAFLMLAEALKARGIATLRYDKQGAGKSTASKKESDMRFSDFVNDAVGFIELLKKDGRFSKVIVLGHSEGSLIGMLAAQQEKADAFISLAGAGYPADVILKKQLETNLPQPLFHTAGVILDSLKSGHEVKQKVPQELFPLFNRGVQPYLISWMKYDPRMEIKKLAVPVLLLQGTTDLQVDTADLQALKEAKPEADLRLIEGMNHVLKQAYGKEENLASYHNPKLPLHPQLINSVMRFVDSLE